MDIKKYADHWLYIVKKRKWTAIWHEEREEIEYACENGMGPIYWCNNCIYGICDDH